MSLVPEHNEGPTSTLDHSPASGLPRLATLPAEILVEVALNTDWNDILRLRQTCRSFADAAKARHVWLSLFRRYHATVFPKPFPLPRPLDLCTSRDFETLVVGYFGWPQRYTNKPHEQRTFNIRAEHSHLLPGGCWALFVQPDGSVLSLHLEAPNASPQPLTPPSIGAPFCHLGTKVSFDFDLGISPLSFNLAVVHWSIGSDSSGTDFGYMGDRMQYFYIYSVVARFDEQGNALGLHATEVASFKETTSHEWPIQCISLLGDHIYYSLLNYPHSIIVNWKEVNGETSNRFPRLYLVSSVRSVAYLLPGDRVVGFNSQSITVWNFSDGTTSRDPPSVAATTLVANSNPCWFKNVGGFMSVINAALLPRLSIHDTTRFVLPTATTLGVCGLVIPDDEPLDSSPPDFWALGPDYMYSGSHFQMKCQWADDCHWLSRGRDQPISLELRVQGMGYITVDGCSNRFLLSDTSKTRHVLIA
ncbi:hypothetical protein BKA70DRAFT_1316561 [Coprinopsis sp. MPI-PUGE-AT-0042]|nr:hypothetical protein BKA70DRAFT_1316561 [Coprinopsis sp. MPI-PUGE-AT-0042]